MMTYILLEYISGKIEIYPLKTKKVYNDIMHKIALDLQHIEDVKIIKMPKKV